VTRFRYLSFLTDYGLEDGFVAACHGVAARIAPACRPARGCRSPRCRKLFDLFDHDAFRLRRLHGTIA
jgi:hypothetical protein